MSMPPPRRRRPPPSSAEPRVRRGAVRVSNDVAWRVRAGHPWIYRDALGGRPMRETPGAALDVLDPAGGFVARGLWDPEGPIALRVFARDPSAVLDGAAARERVAAARTLRERLLAPSLGACRVVHGEADGLPGFTVDKYGDYLVVHQFTEALSGLVPSLQAALVAVWAPRAIYLQQRYRPQTGEGVRGPAQLIHGEAAPVEVVVEESGLRFAVDPTAPLGTGLFLDLRAGRRAVARHAAGRRVLNLFSYTGAFSLYAAHAGAREVVSVDLASRAHARARRNLELNGLTEAGHEFIVGDAAKVMAKMEERHRRFDLVIIDPPSFAQAKGHVFVAQKDYRDLVTAALALVDRGGLLACANNTQKLPLDEFDRIVGDGAGRARRNLAVIERIGLPEDFPVPAGFPEGHYLKFQLCAAIP